MIETTRRRVRTAHRFERLGVVTGAGAEGVRHLPRRHRSICSCVTGHANFPVVTTPARDSVFVGCAPRTVMCFHAPKMVRIAHPTCAGVCGLGRVRTAHRFERLGVVNGAGAEGVRHLPRNRRQPMAEDATGHANFPVVTTPARDSVFVGCALRTVMCFHAPKKVRIAHPTCAGACGLGRVRTAHRFERLGVVNGAGAEGVRHLPRRQGRPDKVGHATGQANFPVVTTPARDSVFVGCAPRTGRKVSAWSMVRDMHPRGGE